MTSSEQPLKNLKVLVNDVEYVNADFAEITVSDGPNGVRLQALPFITKTSSSGGGSAILEALTSVVAARAEAKAQAADAGTTEQNA